MFIAGNIVYVKTPNIQMFSNNVKAMSKLSWLLNSCDIAAIAVIF